MFEEETKIEDWYVILNMNCKYEICRMCPKSGLFKGSYEECEKWIEQKQKEEMKDELHTWKEASENNSYKAFQLQEENKILSKHILELQKDKGELVDRCRELEAQIEKLKCCQNCMHYRHFTKDSTECAMAFITAQNCRHNGFDKWEKNKNEKEYIEIYY